MTFYVGKRHQNQKKHTEIGGHASLLLIAMFLAVMGKQLLIKISPRRPEYTTDVLYPIQNGGDSSTSPWMQPRVPLPWLREATL